MALKIEVIHPANQYSPPFLIIGDNKIFPIVGIEFKGKTEEPEPDPQITEPFHLIKGTIRFLDIFGSPHLIKYDESEEDPDLLWNSRVKSVNSFLKKKGRLPMDNPLKIMPPRLAVEMPEEDWPDWMKHE